MGAWLVWMCVRLLCTHRRESLNTGASSAGAPAGPGIPLPGSLVVRGLGRRQRRLVCQDWLTCDVACVHVCVCVCAHVCTRMGVGRVCMHVYV